MPINTICNMKYIKLLEKFSERYKTRSKSQDLTHHIISLANQIFKDPSGWNEFLISSCAAWVKPYLCQIEFRHKGLPILYCDMKLGQGQILGTEYVLIKIYLGPFNRPLATDLMMPFYNYLKFLFDENHAYTVSDLDDIQAKHLSFEDYENFKDAGKYNL